MARKSAAPAKPARKTPKRTAKAPAEGSTGLTDIERTFVEEYLKDLNGQHAYLRVRPNVKPTSARVEASKILTRPNVLAYLEAKAKKRSEESEITAERVLKEAARLAFFDIRKLTDKDGNPIPVHLLDAETAAAIQGIEFTPSGGLKYKTADKNSAIDRLFKHLGLFKKDNEQTADAMKSLVVEFVAATRPAQS